MNLKICPVILFFSFLTSLSYAQHYPKNYFAAPLDTPLILIGTFGEIRSNHFHSGIDIGTNESEGKSVYAAADGYVSRIKISNNGFGKAIYITHPNGFVTVYGHLKKFNPAIEQYVLKVQYEQKSYEVELMPNKNELIVKKKEVIAFSGSTGDAEGPHLHFEIRDGATEEPINPLLFGLHVNDSLPPVISNFRIFPVADKGILKNTDTASTFNVLKTSSGFKVSTKDTPEVYGSIGFGIEVTDHQQNSEASLGIYSVELKIDHSSIYQYEMDRINFNDMRYVNAHIDYRSKLRDNITIQRCFRLPGNHLNIYPDTTKKGYLVCTKKGIHDLEFIVRDYIGNQSVLNVQLVCNPALSNSTYQPAPKNGTMISEQKGIQIHQTDLAVVIPAGAVYDVYPFETSVTAAKKGMFSPVYQIGDVFVPIHSYMAIGIKPVNLPDKLISKAVLVSIDRLGTKNYEGGSWDGKFLTAKVKHFGEFTLGVDTIAPVVVKEYHDGDLKRNSTLRFKISDEFSGIKSFNAMVDGKWLLMEYNKRESMLAGDISALSKNMKHHLVLKVTDKKNNETTYEEIFYY